jgi:Carboxypeptidase regulatory-like domain/Putative zinc-finger
MSELLQSGQHPDADQLSAFIEHTLPAHEQEQTLAHLAICSHCRSVVALSLPPVEELPAPHPEPVRRPWLSGWNLVWPAAAALAALVLAGIYIRSGIVIPSHAPPTQTAQSFPPAPVKEVPAPKLRQLLPGAGPQKSSRLPAAPVPAPAPQAADNLMRAPNAGGNNLNFRRRETPAGGTSTGQGGAAGAQPSTAVSVTAANRTMQTDSPSVGGILAAGKAQTPLSNHALPSGLPALSTVANGREVIAIDTQNTLFFSNDTGAHWSIITQPWRGRAIKIELVSSSYPLGTGFGAAAPAPVSVAGGTEPQNAVEGPKASLSGKVTDPTGASIANASVVVTNSLTQVARRTKTDPGGRYSVDRLDPGNYTLDVEAPGFTPQQSSGVALNPAQQSQKDLTLAVGSLSQTVEVQGQAQSALAASKVNEKIAAARAAVPALQRFQITTDTGEHWISTDGRSWKRKDGTGIR